MIISLSYKKYLIHGSTSAEVGGTFTASGGVSQPSSAGADAPFETSFKTDTLFLTEAAAHRGGITFAKKLIDSFWVSGGLITHVLLVEDNPADVRLMQEAFRHAKRPIRLHVAADGVEAVTFLRQQGVHLDAPRPDIILLDLNLPKMDGRQVLAVIKKDASLKTIPTLVLTTSDSEEDVAQSYHLQANCYLRKPAQLDAFDNVIRSINELWLTRASLPKTAVPAKAPTDAGLSGS
jgi:two-component system, chemotaxis family, response regulator Rcp1